MKISISFVISLSIALVLLVCHFMWGFPIKLVLVFSWLICALLFFLCSSPGSLALSGLFFSFWLFWDGFEMIRNKSATTKDGRILTGQEAVNDGIMVAALGLLALFLSLYLIFRLSRTPYRNIFTKSIRCPTCGRQKENIQFGKYRCSDCSQKFEINQDGIRVITESSIKIE